MEEASGRFLHWILSNWFPQANCPISLLPSQHCYLNFRNSHCRERLNSIFVQVISGFVLHAMIHAGQTEGTAVIMKSAGPQWHVGMSDLCCTLSPRVLLSVQTKHDGKTLKVKIYVRRRRSWEPSSPLGIAWPPLSQVQSSILRWQVWRKKKHGWKWAQKKIQIQAE